MIKRSAATCLVALAALAPACGPTPVVSQETSVQGRWWTWAYSADDSVSPVRDTTGEFCDHDQPDALWFLAGTYGGTVRRTCRIPAGRTLVFPLVNLHGEAADCATFMAAAKGEAVLDGRPVEPERLDEAGVTVAGVGTVHACGLWARLAPLPAGPHTLTIRGSSGALQVGVDYRLVVEAAPEA
ncbi:signal protein [Nonomuraea wenchangensis]